MSTAERIAALVKKSGMSIRELSRHLGVSNVAVGRWLKGAYEPSGAALDSLCNFFNVTPSYILYGEGGDIELGEYDPSAITIPLYNVTASCGGGQDASPVQILKLIKVDPKFISRFAPGANPKALHMITVEGDSMLPTVADGDSVIIDTSDKYVRRDGLYAVQMGGQIFVKRLQITPRCIKILSDNTLYPPIEVGEQDDFSVIGKCYAGALLRTLI